MAVTLGLRARSNATPNLAFSARGRRNVRGVTEVQISTEMIVDMIEDGGEVTASYPYTYFGPRSWRRMELPSHRALQKGEPYYLECGATAGRYGASILRTGYAGTAPAELRSIHAAAVSAFEAMLGALRPGVRAGHIDDVATSVLQQHGLADSRINKVAYSMGVGFPPGWGEAAVFDLHPANDRLVEEGTLLAGITLTSCAGGPFSAPAAFQVDPVYLDPKLSSRRPAGSGEALNIRSSGTIASLRV